MATPTNLPASFTAGQVLTAAQMNDLRGAFRVLQVVTASQGSGVTNSTTTLADTGLTVSITPQSATSKILVYVAQNGVYKIGVGSGVILALLRGSSVLTYFAAGAAYTGDAAENTVSSSCVFLDSPATTSAVTYKTQFSNRVAASQAAVQAGVGVGTPDSYIVAMEISA
jgi:hypothetical protein